VCFKDKIKVPKKLQKHVIDWYHKVLCHPGTNKTEDSIASHQYWQQSREQVTKYVQTCPSDLTELKQFSFGSFQTLKFFSQSFKLGIRIWMCFCSFTLFSLFGEISEV
jgi:Integrase zinc binding domain